MSDLPAMMFVEAGEESEPTNLLLYGPPGSGKTVAGCSAPGPLLVLNAEGPSALRYSRRVYGNDQIHEVTFTGKATLDAVLAYLRDDPEERTIVVDSIGEIYKKLLRDIGGRAPQIQHYGQVNNLIEDFCRAIRDLPVHVVLIAHEQIDDSEEGGATRRPATGGTKLPEIVMAMVDVVAYCSVLPGEKDEDPPRYVGQLLQARGRRAKDRSGSLGAWRPLNLSEWIATIDAALAPTDAPWDDASAEEDADEPEPAQESLA